MHAAASSAISPVPTRLSDILEGCADLVARVGEVIVLLRRVVGIGRGAGLEDIPRRLLIDAEADGVDSYVVVLHLLAKANGLGIRGSVRIRAVDRLVVDALAILKIVLAVGHQDRRLDRL